MILRAEDNYLRFLAKEYSYLVRVTLDKAMSQLPEGLFVRVHRSFAVSVHYLEQVGKDLVVVGGEPLPLSRKFFPELVGRLNIIGADEVLPKRGGLL